MNGSAVVHPETADPVFRFGPWTWSEPRDGEHFRRCSFCGSVSPEDLAAEPVWRPEWADRKYGWPHKFYVNIPNRDPDRLYCVGTQNGGDAPRGPKWVAVEDFTDDQRALVERDRMSSDRLVAACFDTRPNHFGKFYTIHLSDPALNPAVQADIEQRSGIRFTFADGRVGWGPADSVS